MRNRGGFQEPPGRLFSYDSWNSRQRVVRTLPAAEENMLKSIAVVIGCYLLSVVLVLATDPLLSRLFPGEFERGRVPSDAALIASTALFVVASTICAWVCARFAPGRPGKHVLWFFLIGEVMGAVAAIVNWGKAWPHWYFVSWLIAWPICCYIGLLLGRRREHALSATA
jgi:peptidoglycan/LPS O-acetylase OafA/YrhL